MFVDGSILRPGREDLLYQPWIRCNSMVVSWIRNSVSPQICSSVMYLDDAYSIWSDLNDRFSTSDSARIYQLKQQLMSLSQGTSDVNSYFTNLRIVWDEFKSTQPISWCTCARCNCGSATRWHEHQEHDCTMQFLIGLNPSFSQIRSHILSMVPLPSLSKVFALVIQEERQRHIDGTSFSSPISAPAHIPVPSEQLFANATASYGRGMNKFHCSHCGKTNHPVEKCFLLHGFPPGFGKGRGKAPPSAAYSGNAASNQHRSVNFVEETISATPLPLSSSAASGAVNLPTIDQYQQLISLLQSQHLHNSTSLDCNSTSASHSQPLNNFSGTVFFSPCINSFSSSCSRSSTWILDTGATHHVCFDQSLFSSASPIANASVNLPNGHTAPVTHLGTVQLTSLITFSSVLHVPSFSFNLISVSALTQHTSCTVVFTHNSFQIQEAILGTVIGRGNRVGNLYIFEFPDSPSNAVSNFPSSSQNNVSTISHAVSVNSVVSLDVWHQRLGHPSLNKLKVLSKFLSPTNTHLTNCQICPLEKQKKLPFPVSEFKSSAIFDLIHCDVWGPFSTPTHDGFRYFLTIVDDFSRFVWTFLLTQKSEVHTVMTQFFSTIHTQFSKKIKVMRSDNAPEFNLTSLLSSYGTITQHSCVETPQQNARVERKHQHLLNVARSLMFQSHLSIEFWGECILTASFLINRTPSSVLPDNLTPFQVLFNKNPTYSNLKVFGCLCFASTLDKSKHKFTPRAVKCLFLGYPPGYKGYKVMNLDTYDIFISRNVSFHESEFPLAHQSPSHFPTDIFLPPDTSSSHTDHTLIPQNTSHIPDSASTSYQSNLEELYTLLHTFLITFVIQ